MSDDKPHISLHKGLWYCQEWDWKDSFGSPSPSSAYLEWLTVNSKPIPDLLLKEKPQNQPDE